MTDDLWAADKTIFDPCPPGWQVPDKSVWEGDFITSLTDASLTDNSFTVSGIRYPNTSIRLPSPIKVNGYKVNNGGLVLENQNIYHIFVWAFNGLLSKEYFHYESAVTPGVYPLRPLIYAADYSSAISVYNSAMPSGYQPEYFYRCRPGAVRCVRE